MPGKLPFWKGDAVGRPIELGRALGAFVGEMEADLRPRRQGPARRHEAPARASTTSTSAPPRTSSPTWRTSGRPPAPSPTDKRVVVERFRDELGDWRLTLLTPFGGRVHAPWSLAIESRLQERLGMEVQTIWSDDGIAIRMPEGEASLDGVEELLFPAAEDVEDLVVGQVANSALFASRFRENAARALLLPRRRPGTRTPLWQQRQRAADLLAVASRYGSFPILVETYRECLSDVFDLDALREILGGISSREIAVHGVETPKASPFASSLLFDYVAAYMYDGDTPLAERRAGALTLDRDLLRELLGQEELRELLDPDALADLELSLQALVEDREATTLDQVHDLLRRLGDLSADEVSARTAGGAAVAVPWLAELEAARRAVRVRIAGDERWIAIEDVARYRDGVGVTAPVGVPAAFLGPAAGALDGLLARFAPDPRPVPDARPGAPLGPAAGIVERRPGAPARERLAAASASSGRVARSGSGATPMSCGCCAAAPSRACDARWSRSIRPRSAASSRRGMAWRRSAARARTIAVPRLRRARAPRGGRRSAVGRRHPGVRAGTRRPAGPRARLPAAAARRARRDGRGRLGGAGEPRPRRRPDRAVPPRSRRAAPDRTRGWRGAAGRASATT